MHLCRHMIQKPEQHSGLPASSVITNRSTFLRLSYEVKDDKGRSIKTIPPGNHEWRFSFPLAGDTPESIEGMQGNFIVYDISARLERGFATKDLTSKKHLRIVRTLGPDAMESSVASVGIIIEELKIWVEMLTRASRLFTVYGQTSSNTHLSLPRRTGFSAQQCRQISNSHHCFQNYESSVSSSR